MVNYFNGENKNEVYITMFDESKKIMKSCLKIRIQSDNKKDISIWPGFNKYYYNDMYCQSFCPRKPFCKKGSWDKYCLDEKDTYLIRFHTTRHNDIIHRCLEYHDGKHKYYYSFDRTPLADIRDYEIISCVNLSSCLIDRTVVKEFNRLDKNHINLIPHANTSYISYIFLNPINNISLYEDLNKYNMDSYVLQNDNFEIVLSFETVNENNSTAITDMTGMYIKCHGNLGVGNFAPVHIIMG